MRCPHRFIRYGPCPEGREFIINQPDAHLILYAYTTDQTAGFELIISGQESPPFSSGYIPGIPQNLRSIPALIGLPMRYLQSEFTSLRVYSRRGGSIFIVYAIVDNLDVTRCDEIRHGLVTYHRDLFYIRWINIPFISRIRPSPVPVLTLISGEPSPPQICILSEDFLRHVAPDAVHFNYMAVHQKVIQYIIQYNLRHPLDLGEEPLIITPTELGPLEKLFDYSDLVFRSCAFRGI